MLKAFKRHLPGLRPINPLRYANLNFLKNRKNVSLAVPVMALVFILFWNLNKFEGPVQKTQATAVATKTSPPPVEEEIKPAPKKAVPLQQREVQDWSYRRDDKYLSLDRHEPPYPDAIARDTKQDNDKPGSPETITAAQKPLILAGKGFDIQGFQFRSKEPLHVDFLRHLEKPAAQNKTDAPRDKLDLNLVQVKSSRDLIFHPSRPALGSLPPIPPEERSEPLKEKRFVVEEIPQTRVHFMDSRESALLLLPPDRPLDLLIGNEKINRKQFRTR